MSNLEITLETIRTYGVGRRTLNDELFVNDKPPPRLGVYDLDDENLCHKVVKSSCDVPGCHFTTDSLLEYENHYNSSHRYACSQCKKVLPSPHLLDLHIQESHDSFFAVMAARKPSYCCYIEDCKIKFMAASERLDHCVKVHKLPKDFRFDSKPKSPKRRKGKHTESGETSMELDSVNANQTEHKFLFTNSKQRAFAKYTGRKFTNNSKEISKDVNMDEAMSELKQSLPS